uniref:Metalloendopeptidase n=1 Tax=Xenopus tropicalis TaxID=8364 RepID=A0A803K227_XENTR
MGQPCSRAETCEPAKKMFIGLGLFYTELWDMFINIMLLTPLTYTCTNNRPAFSLETATAGEENKSMFDRLYEVNKDALPFTGKYIVSNLDIALKLGKSANTCPKGICLWPKSSDGLVRIPYVISSDYSSYSNALFQASFKGFADTTCIRLVPRTSETDYLSFESLNGCWSPIGRTGGAQTVSVQQSGCMWTSIIEHEIIHSLGLHHEHVRSDRDKYVSVQWNNISPGNTGNFQMTDTNNMNLTKYDYNSLMHYSSTAFSINGNLPTLIAVPDSSVSFGNAFMMSDLDIKKLNTLYKCEQPKPNVISQLKQILTTTARPTTTTPRATTPKTTTTTTSTTPATTTMKPTTTTQSTTTVTTTTKNGCGGMLSGPSGVITSPNYPNNYPKNSYCHWNITTTSKFKITFTDMDVEYVQYCIWDSVKVYNGPTINEAVLAGTFCGSELPSPITSYQTSMQIVFISDEIVQQKGFSLQYQTV